MSNHLLTLQDYEKNELGTWTLSISNGSEWWNNPENFDKVNEIIKSLFKEVSEKLAAIYVLKAIVVTSDVLEEYDRLLSGTTRKARVDSPREGLLTGKVLTWGNAKNMETYNALVVIDEQICAALTLEEDSVSKALIVHELAHVAERYCTRSVCADLDEDIYLYEWEKIRLSKAKSIFSEYFAQLAAFPYYRNKEDLKSHIYHALDYLKIVKEYLDDEINKYRYSNNMNELWPKAVAELSRVFDAIGRSIGLLSGFRDQFEQEWSNFANEIDKIDSSWTVVFNDLLNALINFKYENINKDAFTEICNAIDKGFKAAGFVPEIRKDGSLFIHVPF